jgi:SAM-dependent methyltransferase
MIPSCRPEGLWTWVAYNVPMSVDSLLDVGCGTGSLGFILKTNWDRKIKRLVGIDISEPFIQECKKLGVYDEVFVYDLNKLPLPFKHKEFEVTVLVDTLEHLEKDVGWELLEELERITYSKILITTNKYWLEAKEISETMRNPYLMHKSLWTEKDFAFFGYECVGMNDSIGFPVLTDVNNSFHILATKVLR